MANRYSTLPLLCACGCGKPTKKWLRNGKPIYSKFLRGHNNNRPLEERFWEKVNKTETCWLWTGSASGPDGYHYGELRVAGKNVRATKVAWEFENGPVPVGLYLCHHCDVTLCIRPSHLFLGTQRDNIRDASEKGRMHGSGLRGSKHWMAKLTDKDVLSIRAQYTPGYGHLIPLAIKFGVRTSTICSIVKRQTWNHI